MQAPKRKTSKSRRDMRRSHHALVRGFKTTCPECKAPVKPHHVCLECGTYRGRQLIKVQASTSGQAA